MKFKVHAHIVNHPTIEIEAESPAEAMKATEDLYSKYIDDGFSVWVDNAQPVHEINLPSEITLFKDSDNEVVLKSYLRENEDDGFDHGWYYDVGSLKIEINTTTTGDLFYGYICKNKDGNNVSYGAGRNDLEEMVKLLERALVQLNGFVF